jgi:hypothetical protein
MCGPHPAGQIGIGGSRAPTARSAAAVGYPNAECKQCGWRRFGRACDAPNAQDVLPDPAIHTHGLTPCEG